MTGNVQPFDVTGWRVRSHTSGFLQISAAESIFEQRSNMRTTFAPFVLVFVDVDPLKWNRLVSLGQQLFQFGSRYWIHSVKLFPLGPFNLARFRQTCLRELIRSLNMDVFGSLTFLLWSIFVCNPHRGQSKKRSARLPRPLAILLSFDEVNSRSSSATVPPVVGKRGALICP